ncbi:hypothetical protein RE9431_22230 [Prescottella equi]|nr:hypothetical protein RE9431_22230 [Prescottella equi]BCN73619.1 hypothetical protein RE0327_22180 [Prescottella equi]
MVGGGADRVRSGGRAPAPGTDREGDTHRRRDHSHRSVHAHLPDRTCSSVSIKIVAVAAYRRPVDEITIVERLPHGGVRTGSATDVMQ